jgi:hypothetical protein
MTLDQIDQLVRKANPVPDLNVLEPVETSVLVLDQQRRTEMQTHDRVEVDQLPREPRRNLFIGIAAVAAIVVGVLVFLRPPDGAPVADQPPIEVATAFVKAFGAFDIDEAVSYLAPNVDLGDFYESEDRLRLGNRMLEAQGFKLMLNSCQEESSSTPETTVRCTFNFHDIRSDEIGLGPFRGSTFEFRILGGEIVWLSMLWEIEDFSPQVWEPFSIWVSQTYPDDFAIMYTDSSAHFERLTEESIALWEQRSREYVPVAQERTEKIAVDFVEAYSTFDVDKAASYLAADADLSRLEAGVEGWQLGVRWLEAAGFKVLLDSCAVEIGSPAGTVRCLFAFHAIRSDEIGLGPFGDSRFDFRILGGEIVSASMMWNIEEFGPQMWEPFAVWVAETYPEDVTIMYTGSDQSMQRFTDESIALWEQRTREYVDVVGGLPNPTTRKPPWG